MTLEFSALILSAGIIAVLFMTRHLSLRVLEEMPNFTDRYRYVRGARWGWLIVTGSFVVVVAAMIVFTQHTVWDFRTTALAWTVAIFPVAGSIGLLLMPEFMGFWVWAQALWDDLGGGRIDWGNYRAIAERIASNRARWSYYAAWVVGSLALTVGPLWTCVAVHAG